MITSCMPSCPWGLDTPLIVLDSLLQITHIKFTCLVLVEATKPETAET